MDKQLDFLEHVEEFEVRDYEIDLQGIVNNGNYFHYYEHARHKMAIETLKLDFAELHKNGVDLVVVRSEIDYKNSLKSLDNFFVKSIFKRVSKIKFVFEQTIFKKDETVVSKAVFYVACLVNGRPSIIPELEKFNIIK